MRHLAPRHVHSAQHTSSLFYIRWLSTHNCPLSFALCIRNLGACVGKGCIDAANGVSVRRKARLSVRARVPRAKGALVPFSYLRTHTHVYICICVYIFVHIYMYIYVYAHICTYINIYICTHMLHTHALPIDMYLYIYARLRACSGLHLQDSLLCVTRHD